MGLTVRLRRMDLRLGRLFLEQLEIFGSAGIRRKSQCSGCGSLLFFGIGRSRQTKALSGLASYKHRARKGGSGGRIEALQELNADHVALVGVDVSGAFLQSIRLSGAKLLRSNFSATDSRGGDFRYADFTDADLSSANFRGGNFYRAWLQGAQVNDADLFGADPTEANLAGANLANADLRDANLSNIRWREIANIKMANIHGVKNEPDGFVSWAVKNGAVTTEPNPE